MADKNYKLSFEMSDGTTREVMFTAPQGPQGPQGPSGMTVDLTGAIEGEVNPVNADTLGGKTSAYYAPATKLTPRNLLDNSDFRNPVNQRNFTGGAVSAWEYFADRWRGAADGANVTLENNGIRLNSGGICETILDLSLSGRTLTYAVCEDDETITLMTFTPTLGAYAQIDGNESDRLKLVVGVGGKNNNGLYMYIFSKAVTTIRWAALYEGEYTLDTLPEYQPKGYGVELAECQRYLRKFRWLGGETMYAPIRVQFPLPMPMRIENPTVNYTVLSGDGTVTVSMIKNHAVDIAVAAGFAVLEITVNADL